MARDSQAAMKRRGLGITHSKSESIFAQVRRIEGREWWLWGFAVAVTLALTFAIVSFTWFHFQYDATYWFDLKEWVRGLAALVLLFDVYTVYQHLQLHRIRRQLAERDQLFQLICCRHDRLGRQRRQPFVQQPSL
jgi:hypothetical protein